MSIGTVQSQVNLQMLDMKWQKKKNDINQKKNGNLSQEEIFLQSLEDQAADVRKGRDTEQIYTKLKTGGTLTADEIAYLKEHDPEALAEYEKAQVEKKAYENKLKNCKTKEEVERVKMNHMGNFAAQAKAIANNPYIPKEKKLELMNRLNNQVCCIRDAHMEYVKSRAYEELPEEAEIAEKRTGEKTAENDELSVEQMEADEEASGEIKQEIETNKESMEAKDLSFEKISRDIERYLRKNGEKKSTFVTNV